MDSIPAQMTRIAIRDGKGDAHALYPETVPTPQPGSGEVLIRMHAAGVNRPDLLQRKGLYPPPPGAPDTLGLEVAGEVVALGNRAARWKVGDAVCALLGGGGYAQYVAVDARQVLPIPADVDMVQAAALPETIFTVFSNVFERARLQAGETLLIHGATSGIGVTAILMGRAAGARVIATGRGAAKAEAARRLEVDLALDASMGDWSEAVQAAGGVDVVLDMVGGDYLAKNLAVLKPDGRLAQIAFLAGAKVEVDLSLMLGKRLTLTASTLRARSAQEKGRLAAAIEARVWPWVASGQVRPPVDRSFALTDAAAAHAYLEAGEHVGKVVLEA